ncbi:MAG TPA: iron-sulfur cluster assembly protein [Pseudonocardia sp.]|jgi:metal-sulfur cluster biosynthetic enzyme
MPGPEPSVAQVRAALNTVIDPCSAAMGDDLSLVELGMVYEIGIETGTVTVDLLFDDPMCLYLAPIHDAIRRKVRALPGVVAVVIDQSERELWTEDRIEPAARDRLLAARRRRWAGHSGPVPVSIAAPAPRPTR